MKKIFFKNSSGFTLIELLVVISIVGLLATLAITSLSSARAKAKDTKRLAEIKTIKEAFDLFFDTNGNYGAGCGLGQAVSSCTGLAPFLKIDILKDPSSSATVCIGNNTSECNYGVYGGTTVGRHYALFFHLEKSTVLGNSGETNCVATDIGTACNSLIRINDCLAANINNAKWNYCYVWDADGSGVINILDLNAFKF